MSVAPCDRLREFQIEIHLAFFAGDADVEALRASLPPEVNAIKNRGRRSKSLDLPRTSLVVFRSRSNAWDASLGEHWDYLDNITRDYCPQLIDLAKLCERVSFMVVVDLCEGPPVLILPEAAVQFCASLGALIEVDVMDDRGL